MKKLIAAATIAALSLPGMALAQETPGAGPDVSGVDLTGMQTTATTLFADHIPTIVAIGAIGFAVSFVIGMIRKAKSVGR